MVPETNEAKDFPTSQAIFTTHRSQKSWQDHNARKHDHNDDKIALEGRLAVSLKDEYSHELAIKERRDRLCGKENYFN
ncbi:hypothetical protein ES703_96534 [subsurface metagenome]